jgi:hypothetical protein
MKSLFKSLNATQPTPLVSLFAVITTVLAGAFVYQKFFGSPFIDFGPIMIWLAVAIPMGIFAAIFLQVRAGERTQQLARQVHASIAELQANPRLEDARHAPGVTVQQPYPEKDPFENL